MRISHSASRSLTSAVLLALALGACSKDQGPSEFNPDGMSADITTAQAAFNSPASESFAASGSAMAQVLGASAPAVVSPVRALKDPASARHYAQSVVRLLPKAGGLSAAVAAIPSNLLGTTFVWDLETGGYVASEETGAPATGVRFLLYALNPVTFEPADPLSEMGYVDITDVGAGATVGRRVLVVAAGVTYLDYTATGTGTQSSGTLAIQGFASNGTNRVNFSLGTTVAQAPSGMVLTLDFSLGVPTRGLTITYTATFANLTPEEVAVTLDYTVSGRNGDARVSGTYGADGGSFSVRVNGELFATVAIGAGGEDPVITSATGTELTIGERAVLHLIIAFYDGSLAVFDGLLEPVM